MSAGGRGSRRQFLRGEDKQRVPPIDRRSLEVRLRWSARACANRAFSGAVRQAISGPPGKPSGGVRCSYGYEEDHAEAPLLAAWPDRRAARPANGDLVRFEKAEGLPTVARLRSTRLYRGGPDAPAGCRRQGRQTADICLIPDIDNSGSCGLTIVSRSDRGRSRTWRSSQALARGWASPCGGGNGFCWPPTVRRRARKCPR